MNLPFSPSIPRIIYYYSENKVSVISGKVQKVLQGYSNYGSTALERKRQINHWTKIHIPEIHEHLTYKTHEVKIKNNAFEESVLEKKRDSALHYTKHSY